MIYYIEGLLRAEDLDVLAKLTAARTVAFASTSVHAQTVATPVQRGNRTSPRLCRRSREDPTSCPLSAGQICRNSPPAPPKADSAAQPQSQSSKRSAKASQGDNPNSSLHNEISGAIDVAAGQPGTPTRLVP